MNLPFVLLHTLAGSFILAILSKLPPEWGGQHLGPIGSAGPGKALGLWALAVISGNREATNPVLSTIGELPPIPLAPSHSSSLCSFSSDVPQTYPHHTATQAQLCCDCFPEQDVTRHSRTWADSWRLHPPVTFSSLTAAYPPIPSPHFPRKKCWYLSLPDFSYLFSDCN